MLFVRVTVMFTTEQPGKGGRLLDSAKTVFILNDGFKAIQMPLKWAQ